ncbi:hypothetical protein VNO77_29562 [Canavalia gladiata]|uniref:Transmembrane protein n=1 Tax=Canavalia gladiata TaxID=3824 RepID=A0AAN9KMA5_CANGL
MKYLKHQNAKVHNSKRSMKFLLCIFLLCLLFSLLPLQLHSLKPFLMQFYAYTVDKTYMFLLCNGLLVLIALNSGLIHSPLPQTTHLSIQQHAIHSEKTSQLELKASHIAAPIACENLVETESSQEEEEEHILSKVEQENDEEESNGIVMIDEDDTEELNKRCEEFIKRMKAEIRADCSLYFDNNRSLVAVN